MKGSEDHDEGRYRYWSWRAWDADKPTLGWVILRPNEYVLRNLMGLSFRHGYGSVSVCHAFAGRTDSFNLLMAMRDPVGPLCDDVLFSRMGEVDRFVCAWTDSALKRGRATGLMGDPRWSSISHKGFAFKISRNHQPSFGFGKMGGMLPYQTPRVSDKTSDMIQASA